MKSDTLLLLGVVVLIVASLAYVGSYYYTGKITAYVNATINTLNSIRFSNTTLNWGTGSVGAGSSECVLSTNGTNLECTGFNTISTDLQVINDGNVNVSLNISSSITGGGFIGGNDPYFQYNATQSESASCVQRRIGVALTGSCNLTNSSNINTTRVLNSGQMASYLAFGTAATIELCECFRPQDTSDAIDIEIRLVVPSDATIGTRNATITVTADTID